MSKYTPDNRVYIGAFTFIPVNQAADKQDMISQLDDSIGALLEFATPEISGEENRTITLKSIHAMLLNLKAQSSALTKV